MNKLQCAHTYYKKVLAVYKAELKHTSIVFDALSCLAFIQLANNLNISHDMKCKKLGMSATWLDNARKQGLRLGYLKNDKQFGKYKVTAAGKKELTKIENFFKKIDEKIENCGLKLEKGE